MLQPVDIAGRCCTRRIGRIALVDGPDGDRVVETGVDVDGRVLGLRERNLERRDGGIALEILLPGLYFLVAIADILSLAYFRSVELLKNNLIRANLDHLDPS